MCLNNPQSLSENIETDVTSFVRRVIVDFHQNNPESREKNSDISSGRFSQNETQRSIAIATGNISSRGAINHSRGFESRAAVHVYWPHRETL